MSEDVKPYGDELPAVTPDELRELLAEVGLSQRAAARELGVDDRTLRYWAAGQSPIPRMAIYALRFLVSQEHERAGRLVDLQVKPTDRRTRVAAELPAGSIYLLTPEGKRIAEHTLATSNVRVARNYLRQKDEAGEAYEAWLATRTVV